MRVLSKAFGRLKLTLPWVPPDTKLSKLDTLRLAMSYIAHLKRTLEDPDDQEQGCKQTKYWPHVGVRSSSPTPYPSPAPYPSPTHYPSPTPYPSPPTLRSGSFHSPACREESNYSTHPLPDSSLQGEKEPSFKLNLIQDCSDLSYPRLSYRCVTSCGTADSSTVDNCSADSAVTFINSTQLRQFKDIFSSVQNEEEEEENVEKEIFKDGLCF
ncbi:uncharacterized protein LOC111710265 [Eurytemora carolleeae]|uniref:uncharacterized protein LOC111710265 n=1 Tax=Eurytemora carolleeae TaxID=1294199 RepID=UPI000C7884F1|nr:uncharacterized protein LOC111710265 [Eurytemora carolleeae]|eukprot:XP_023340100.1 uncharacterized protein LOC111710265 [Eurytemora affinis]